ncbi:hypothetical protein GLAREA_08759 [Glarea lozoyensis ATCC 20868]|uniref:Uncharacterized protein n=1 Tax=Glarea lozoyensis (strain ATCC 20868 / MF5171) TaxID=1116229 RepID=S3DXB7_GLAL2|nr:uncharacterized protein GLAREA_08759 [Glarea lozoyensis ATCC 20868]EPE36596.1 hypothetical protein GLAREA_08759 [Glarea lozoyensis ATCC 20868]
MIKEKSDPLACRRTRTQVKAPYTVQDEIKHPRRSLSIFCVFCQRVIDQWPRSTAETPRFKHHSSLGTLQRSADQGCGLCAQFIVGVEELEEAENFDVDGKPELLGLLND